MRRDFALRRPAGGASRFFCARFVRRIDRVNSAETHDEPNRLGACLAARTADVVVCDAEGIRQLLHEAQAASVRIRRTGRSDQRLTVVPVGDPDAHLTRGLLDLDRERARGVTNAVGRKLRHHESDEARQLGADATEVPGGETASVGNHRG